MVCVCATEALYAEMIRAMNVLLDHTAPTKALSIHVLCIHILMLVHGSFHNVLVYMAFTAALETAASAL